MDRDNIIESFAGLKDIKNIDRVKMIRVLESVFLDLIERKFGSAENYDIIINAEKGDIQIWRNREIVEDKDVEDDNSQIGITEAQKIEEDFEVGEDISDEIKIASFGRRAIQTAKVNMQNKIIDIERGEMVKRYEDRIDEIVSAEVYRIWKREILLLDDYGNEMILPKNQQIPRDYFNKGDNVRAVVHTIENMHTNPKVILSRTSPEFLKRLFEIEVPEIADGLVIIKEVIREPGDRAKVAVESYDDRIDPVGACVGMKGSRIHGVVRELKNENIDIINYTENDSLFITRSLSPATITKIDIDKEKRTAFVYLKPDQVSLAIGKEGINIKLAAKLTGYEINVFRDIDEDEFDVELSEFVDEIENWVIEELKKIGCETAKSVLQYSKEALAKKTDLEEETIENVLNVLKEEFE